MKGTSVLLGLTAIWAAASRPGNEVFALLGRTGTGQCLVAVTGTALSHCPCFWRRPRPAPAAASDLAGPRLALLVATSTAVFSLSSAVEAAQPERSCPFASGEASGSECIRLAPQIRSQPTHPVRQRITWHP